jgi:hypothetical protein
MLSWFPKTLWRSLPSQDQLPLPHGQTMPVTDTIPVSAASADPQIVDQILWKRQTFNATFDHKTDGGDLAIHFPSPLPMGNPFWDNVVVDWHVARSRGRFVKGPAVLVLDILQGGNLVAGYIAKKMAKNGIHGFVLHMPQNGRRKAADQEYDWSRFLPSLRQAAGDARRCRDVIAALPLIEGAISIQGTSLGGFIATLAGSIDRAFDHVFLALSGGDTYGVLTTGKADAARVREHLLKSGYDDQTLRDSLWDIEPLRVAHRLDPRRTWLYSACFDKVVSRRSSRKLARAIGLDSRHHRQLFGGHYTCVLDGWRFLSKIVEAVRKPAA